MENLLFCHLSGEKDDKANITELDHRHRHAPNCHPLAPRLNYHLGILWELCDCGWGLLHPDKFFGSEQCIDQHLAAVCYYIIAPNDMQRNYLKFNFRTANSGHKTHTHTHIAHKGQIGIITTLTVRLSVSQSASQSVVQFAVPWSPNGYLILNSQACARVLG